MPNPGRPAWKRSVLPVVVAFAVATATSASASGQTPEEAYLAENTAAMSRMMAGMAIKPGGDIDSDFVAMMIPHHQGAIDMAIAELRYGRNEQLRRIAQEIIVNQQQEISAMRLAKGQPLASSVSSPKSRPAAEMRMSHPGEGR